MAELAFVTGATGFLGLHVVRSLLDRGLRVRCLVRRGTNAVNLEGLAVERIEGDLDDAAALAAGCDSARLVFHLAALVSFARRDRDVMFRVNVDGTQNVADAALGAGVGRLVHCSSVAAVGALPPGMRRSLRPLDESADWNLGPADVAYCTSKREAELVLGPFQERGLDVVTLCPVTLVGPGDRKPDAQSTLRAAARGAIRLAPPGGLALADVRDVAVATVEAGLRSGASGRYVLGGTNLTGMEFAAALCEATGRPSPRASIPRFACGPTAWIAAQIEKRRNLPTPLQAEVLRLAPYTFWFDSSRAAAELGYRNRPLDETLGDAVAWMQRAR
ncbi:MAG: NAD-dependent epimerase/dehydratase family protein [Planctomycetota bacterium]